MSIKITVDNNFFDNFYKLPDTSVREKILHDFEISRFSFYPTKTLLTELLCMYAKEEDRPRLRKYCDYALRMMRGRIFKDWREIVRQEVGAISSSGIFMEASAVRSIKDALERIAGGRDLEDREKLIGQLAAEVLREKKKSKTNRRERHRRIEELYKKAGVDPHTVSFEELHGLFYDPEHMPRLKEQIIGHLFEGKRDPAIEAKVDNVINNRSAYPYFEAQSRVSSALYYQSVLKGKIKHGDDYDCEQLHYLVGLDHIISDDPGLSELSKIAYGNNKVLTCDEFASLAR